MLYTNAISYQCFQPVAGAARGWLHTPITVIAVSLDAVLCFLIWSTTCMVPEASQTFICKALQ